MKLLTIFALSFLLLLSCPKNKLNNIDTYVDIKYENAVGLDLLDPQKGIYNVNDIKIYYVDKNDKPVLYYEPKYDNKYGFLLYKNNISAQFYVIRVFTSNIDAEDKNTTTATTLLQLNSTVTDTIKCEVHNSKNSRVVSNVWYNGQLKYPNNDFPNEYGRIIKVIH